MSAGKLVLECINGPLDGLQIELQTESEWRCTGEGPLAFPWDTELGDPQARLTPQENAWWIEGYAAAHGTYQINRDPATVPVGEKIRLEVGAVLKASGT